MTENMPRCEGRDEVAQLVHGELPGEERRRMLAHLGTCAVCRARFTEMVAVEAEYARLPAPRLASAEKERLIEHATDAGSATRAATRRSSAPSGIPWRALAAAAVVALAYLAGWATSPSATVDPAMAERLAGIEAELVELRRSRLQVAVEHPSAVVRMQEIVAVRAVDSESVTALLVRVLERDPNPNVRLAALDALRAGDLSESDAQAVLQRLLSEPSPLLRSALIDFVVNQQIEGRRSLLERLERSDDDPTVRAKAHSALERLT